ncbi:RNA 2',3'-cyclic phosphodiesterase [Patescibacteria group bacterium]|jgi:2'-5' RNA ligase|uniref:RNA 2',3'-cyclic phosphodiesterase n=1 Tax=candidate division WWE3 bacterium TaxID=2053526 RepID=A0A928TS46_UNCKA|nr:RNA 2',3'-cyclic phosphodiesterase [candidate division WWE3 bacterium]MCL4732271.1 RNA 2',3'-cyclic phosphodiesterase [Patescibacteria group bacterium]MDL1953170.1 RNA 2',3'-cyclic phosphodiesterase [Candidatus Uhrbacteria bacterium UHB]RIL00374.1 MAG: RNA 2',3'-cyclic phosphodiesterase [Candidatus Uhrbacteria bacterium]
MRCFIAIPLADELRDLLSASLSSSDRPRSVRRIDDALWHLTVAFLGDIVEGSIPKIIKALSYIRDCPGTIALHSFETFPAHRRSLIVAAGSAEPAGDWNAFVQDIRNAVRPYAPGMDEKAWHAHITLCRANKNEMLPPWRKDFGPVTWKPGGFALIQSALSETGPIYRTLHEFPFKH